jgi:mRNA-degrading endonuclease toxin of MazEF toxin-antitoxin module
LPNRGEVYLAPFLYSDLAGSKRRPVCIVSAAAANAGPDVVVVMITASPLRRLQPLVGDVVLRGWQEAGLLRESVARCGRLQVVESRLLSALLGQLSAEDIGAVETALKTVLALD